jgi:hypothetical protein
MTVASTLQASHAYATSSIHKTNSISQNTNTQTTKNVDKMDEMKEKYKDIYTPVSETYSKAVKIYKHRKFMRLILIIYILVKF